jgi:hypothetical protein
VLGGSGHWTRVWLSLFLAPPIPKLT